MAPLMVLGGPSVAPYTVRGDHLFCHGQSGGTAFRGDRLSCDRSGVYSSYIHVVSYFL